MSIREASFGDLFKIGFWVQLGPAVLGALVVGAMFTAYVLIFPDLLELLAEANLLPIPQSAYESGQGAMIGFVWAVTAVYAVVMAALTVLRTVSGALIVMVWRKTFVRPVATS